MSRLFNQMKTNQGMSQSAEPEREVDVDQLVGQVKQNASVTANGNNGNALASVNVDEIFASARAVAVEMADSRLQRCRKIAVPGNTQLLGLSAEYQSPNLAVESYRALRTRLARIQASQGICSVVITSALPGEGKTMTTLNTAICCAQIHDFRVLMVDADLRTSGLTYRLGNPPGAGLAEVLSGKTNYKEAIASTPLDNLHVLTAGHGPISPPELFADSRWKEFLAWASESFKLVLIDAPPVGPLADFELIAAPSDAVIMVLRALRTERELVQQSAGRIDKAKLLGVVFNGAQITRDSYYNHYYYGSRKQ